MSSNVNADGDSVSVAVASLLPRGDAKGERASARRTESDRQEKHDLPQDTNSSIQTSIPDIVCPRCGALIKKRYGTKKTKARLVQRYQCLNGHVFTPQQ